MQDGSSNIYVDGGEADLAQDADYTQDTMENGQEEEGESIYMIDGVTMRLIQIEGEEQ